MTWPGLFGQPHPSPIAKPQINTLCLSLAQRVPSGFLTWLQLLDQKWPVWVQDSAQLTPLGLEMDPLIWMYGLPAEPPGCPPTSVLNGI